MKCLECGVLLKNTKSLVSHLRHHHKSISSKIYYDKHLKNISEGVCLTCRKSTKYINLSKGYREFCSRKCISNNNSVKHKKKETFINKYGVENPFMNEDIKNKIKETFIKKYGVEHPSMNEDFKNKRKKFFIEKYGVENPSQNEDFKNKRKETFINKYGVENPFMNEGVKNRIKETFIKKYGVAHPSMNEEVKHKRKDTCIEKYGVEHPFMNDDVKQRIKETFLKKYGVEHPLQNEDVLNKRKDTCIKKYGVEHPSMNEDVKQRIKETFIKNYGVEHPFMNEDVLNKIKETCLKKYGVEYANQSSIVKKKIRDTHINNRLPKIKKLLKSLNIEMISSYTNSRDSISLKCLLCNTIFKSFYFNLQQGYGKCPNCFPRYKSIAEQEIVNFINNLGIKTINNSHEIISPYEIDIYIPSKKIGIEYNGLYYHSENCGKDKNYHLNKLNKCLEKDIKLLQIFEDEWLSLQDIVKSRLRQILGINKSISYNNECNSYKRIHARKCIIEEIDSKTKNDFLEKYHLQGKDGSNIKLGAFYNEELVAVMTFSHGNIAKGSKYKEGVWELNRFCSDSNYHIPGIASKLLSSFKKNYSWKEIFSYADRRWSTGNLYYKLGFSLKYVTKPNYWYVKGINRIHRFNLRKKSNEPKDIPEWILRLEKGYSRVWDCGHLKFVKSKDFV